MRLKHLHKRQVTTRTILFFFLAPFFLAAALPLVAQEAADEAIIAVPSINANNVSEALASACRNMVEQNIG